MIGHTTWWTCESVPLCVVLGCAVLCRAVWRARSRKRPTALLPSPPTQHKNKTNTKTNKSTPKKDESMIRVFKTYDWSGLHSERYAARTVACSSYPGMISSLDDFYILQPVGLVVTEVCRGEGGACCGDDVRAAGAHA